AVLGWRYQSADQPKSIWFTESVEPGVIYAGYAVRTHYIRVAIRFDDQVVTTSIVSSKNLDYSENRIHEVAFVWIDELETHIRRALGTAAAAKRLSGQSPEGFYPASTLDNPSNRRY